MNAVAAVAVAPSPRVEAVWATCFHCAEALPPSPARLFIDGTERLFCCAGCAGRHAMDPRRATGRLLHTAQRPLRASRTKTRTWPVWDSEEVLAEHARPIAGDSN